LGISNRASENNEDDRPDDGTSRSRKPSHVGDCSRDGANPLLRAKLHSETETWPTANTVRRTG
jgi:hypothetical protein